MQATSGGPVAEMPRFYGTKQIWALQIAGVVNDELRFVDTFYAPRAVGFEFVDKHNPQPGGYLVVYEGGYLSFSPAEPFEQAYRPNGSLSFGHVIMALKDGRRARREGWNGKGMWIGVTKGSTLDWDTGLSGVARKVRDIEAPDKIVIGSHIDMRAADGSVVIGWLASQTDMLADDWSVLG